MAIRPFAQPPGAFIGRNSILEGPQCKCVRQSRGSAECAVEHDNGGQICRSHQDSNRAVAGSLRRGESGQRKMMKPIDVASDEDAATDVLGTYTPSGHPDLRFHRTLQPLVHRDDVLARGRTTLGFPGLGYLPFCGTAKCNRSFPPSMTHSHRYDDGQSGPEGPNPETFGTLCRPYPATNGPALRLPRWKRGV